MSRRAPNRERALCELIARAEREIALLDRVQPRNAGPERVRLREAWRSGKAIAPDHRYAPVPDLGELRAALSVAARTSADSLIEALCVERAAELEIEAELVSAVSTSRFVELSKRRFAPAEDELKTAEELLASWLTLAPGSEVDSRHRSDDAADPKSLLGVLRREIGRHRLPIRVEVRDDLSSTAATGDGVVLVRGKIWLNARDAERIAHHEIFAHALPRVRSRAHGGIFALGSAGAADDEEGRAICLEERAGYLDANRRLALARRHLAALSARNGASFVEAVRMLEAQGTPLDAAIDLGCRVFRGGGLAREIVYLTGYVRVKRAFERRPELEPMLAAGRLGVRAAERLLDAGFSVGGPQRV